MLLEHRGDWIASKPAPTDPLPAKTLYNVRFLAILNPRSFSEHVATLPEMQFRIHL
ncbi:hypothetical protein EMIT0P44_150091 [Pseudomonas sp. IT-P44]